MMMTEKEQTGISKFLSLILRHKPETIGITLDENGWTSVEDLIQRSIEHGKRMNVETLDFIVSSNNKKRFAFNEDKTKIRASQGHSVKIELGYEPQMPPDTLYHGTGKKYVNSIEKTGIIRKNRHHVHLSTDKETALKVGQRHGTPVIFEVRSAAMNMEGYEFFVSENGVWLTDEVPVQYLRKL